MITGVRISFENTLIPLQRLQSLAFGFGTFAYAKDQASSPLDGFLKDNPTPFLITYFGLLYDLLCINSYSRGI
jgi:hypothetical protein